MKKTTSACIASAIVSVFVTAHAQNSAAGYMSPAVPGESAVGLTGFAAASAPLPTDGLAAMAQQSLKNNGIGANIQSDSTTALTSPAARVVKPQEPSQFELFVKNATGKRLPIYGAELFETPQTFSPVTNVPAPVNYVLAPGDEVQLQVWGATNLNLNLTIDRQGQVMVPRVGPLSLVGVQAGQLDGVFKAHLTKVLANVEVAAHVSKLRSIQVYVVGHAAQPGVYTLSSLSTLVNALFASGGPGNKGSMRQIQLKRGGKTVSQLDLYDFIGAGNAQTDVALQTGDVIVIPPVGPRVAIHGAFDHAAIYELKPAETTLKDILAKGGGVPVLATSQKALLERVVPSAQPPRQVADLALNDIGLSTALKDGDIVTLLGISPEFSNAVTLQGSVDTPSRHAYKNGMRVSDLIPDVEALIVKDYYNKKNSRVQVDDRKKTISENKNFVAKNVDRIDVDDVNKKIKNDLESINWSYASIERLNRKTLENQLISFNLGKAVLERDSNHDIELQPGDVVTVFSTKDIQLPMDKQLRMVKVEGEVAAPGLYPLLPGETLPQLLRRIGGLTPQAYVYGMEFTRESVRKQQQENLNKIISKLEQTLTAQVGSEAASLSGELGSKALANFELQKQSTQQQISRLRNFQSNGRVALELNTQDQSLAALPTMPLEDGDRIVVPALPSFVSAYGAINNENALVYRSGRTVSDVLNAVGPTSDADLDQTFVLRADGTVVTANSQNSWFGRGLNGLRLMPGDTVVVPPKTPSISTFDKTLGYAKDITQIFSNLGLGVAAIRSIQNN
ncbi:polysaccharide biosynthesis/export family protein [Macromonas bipunctata]|uniref:polysaccharide biosynthesis/export family protein n=1 Tax=Macromonas bipunctata TaxID=183670 RepID=UPI001F0C3761|nr:SLBB domain-containing protein [Macromonas bipunctata]